MGKAIEIGGKAIASGSWSPASDTTVIPSIDVGTADFSHFLLVRGNVKTYTSADIRAVGMRYHDFNTGLSNITFGTSSGSDPVNGTVSYSATKSGSVISFTTEIASRTGKFYSGETYYWYAW